MADSLWNVIGDVAGQAAQDIPAWKQSKLNAQHKAAIDALAQRHARQLYDIQMRGLDIKEQQALAAQHAQELKDTNNQHNYEALDRRMSETERHNQAMEGVGLQRESRLDRPPDIVSQTRTGLMGDIKDWRSSRTPRPLGQSEEYPYKTIYGPDPSSSPNQPTLGNAGISGVPSRLDLARQSAEYYGLPADSVEWRLTGQPTGQFGLRSGNSPQIARPPQNSGAGWGGLGTNMTQPGPTPEEIDAELKRRGVL